MAFKALCEKETQELMDAYSGVLELSSDVPLTKKEKRKLALQQPKTVAKKET